jgi:hypothetical protein
MNYTIISYKKTFQPDSIQSVLNFNEISYLPFEPLISINWGEYPYKPDVCFKIIHFNNGLLVMYKVEENHVKATVINDNGPVYNDSCVELFISPAGDDFYYNFEFNAIGSLLLGYGNQRHNRMLAPNEVLHSISRFSSIGFQPVDNYGNIQWELFAFIPFTAFFKHSINNLEGLHPKGNIYKCGNLLQVPHYVSWSPVLTEKPDFHRPEFFGGFTISKCSI